MCKNKNGSEVKHIKDAFKSGKTSKGTQQVKQQNEGGVIQCSSTRNKKNNNNQAKTDRQKKNKETDKETELLA